MHLPMLFQLAPRAVSDLLSEAQATDDDPVSCTEIFTDGSSLIPRAWPRVAASGGWGVLITAICDTQHIAVVGMFFREVTVDSGQQLFGGADSRSVLITSRLWRGVTLPTWRSKMSKSDPTASLPFEYWTGVTVAFHTCGWCEPRDSAWRKQEASFVSPKHT